MIRATRPSDPYDPWIPGAFGQRVSRDILSGKRKIEDHLYLQTDVSVSPGNSGGPLFNSKGEMIGIIQSKAVGAGIEGVGFAVPIDEVRKRSYLVDQP